MGQSLLAPALCFPNFYQSFPEEFLRVQSKRPKGKESTDSTPIRPRSMSNINARSCYALSLIVDILGASLKSAFVFTLPLVLAACATESTGPIAAGNGTFVVSRQAGALPSGREPLLVQAIGEANAKCSGLGQSMKLISQTENSGPYILGNYPKATVVFSCQ
jgi:hypothetical protein